MAEPDLLRVGGLRWTLAAVSLVVGVAAIAGHVVGERRDTDAVSFVLGGDATALGKRMFEARDGLGVQLSNAEREALKQRIADRPLDGTGFALAALDATARGDKAQAARLVAHALALDPRTRLAWLWRLDDQARSQQNIAAANTVLRLLAVDPGQYPIYVPILAMLSKDSRNIAQIAAALRGNPGWREPFLNLLQSGGFDPAIRYALMGGPATRALTSDREQASFVSDLIAKGDYERAYLAWVSYLPDKALAGVDTPYDAQFAGLPGPAPFNWELTADEGDRADTGDGGLDLSYSGRKAAALASQIVVLQPGAYVLRSVLTSAGSEGPNGGTTLTWQAQCLPGNIPIGALALDASITGKPQVSPAFRVPDSGCSAVRLVLAGAASEFPVRLNAKIALVHIDKIAIATIATKAALPAVSASAIPAPQPGILP